MFLLKTIPLSILALSVAASSVRLSVGVNVPEDGAVESASDPRNKHSTAGDKTSQVCVPSDCDTMCKNIKCKYGQCQSTICVCYDCGPAASHDLSAGYSMVCGGDKAKLCRTYCYCENDGLVKCDGSFDIQLRCGVDCQCVKTARGGIGNGQEVLVEL